MTKEYEHVMYILSTAKKIKQGVSMDDIKKILTLITINLIALAFYVIGYITAKRKRGRENEEKKSHETDNDQ